MGKLWALWGCTTAGQFLLLNQRSTEQKDISKNFVTSMVLHFLRFDTIDKTTRRYIVLKRASDSQSLIQNCKPTG
uniref:Uncharacterized protein n=1 Tax=Anguilla anguilla TaxID=7936 RepID=A0A0E9X3W4_ANGAN